MKVLVSARLSKNYVGESFEVTPLHNEVAVLNCGD